MSLLASIDRRRAGLREENRVRSIGLCRRTPLKRLAAIGTLAVAALAPLRVAAQDGCGAKPATAVVDALRKEAPSLNVEVLKLALTGVKCAAKRGLVPRNDLLTVIDYSLPSTQPRLFVFDLNSNRLLFNELVAHGKNSGENKTKFFSNVHGSLATSIGLYVTANTYFGNNGYSLRLKGLDEGFNDQAWERAIVMHGASYVSKKTAEALGRLGRSWGCPAVRAEIAKKLIDTVKGGTPVFAYYPDENWLKSSRFFR